MLDKYFFALKSQFEAAADEAKAAAEKRYMKNLFDYYGIKTPLRRELFTAFIKQHGLPPDNLLTDFAKQLWEQSEREWQYTCIDLLKKRAKNLPPETIDLYEYMVINKSWWDSVDGIASWLVGTHFKNYPELIPTTTERWMNSGNMWLQRTCLLYQLQYKTKTDTELLSSFILRLSDSKEFFIRKAIGWILREYSKTNPDWVMQFAENNELSKLSRYEGLRIILKQRDELK